MALSQAQKDKPHEFAPETVEDLIAHWEFMASEASAQHNEYDNQDFKIHANQAYGKMIGYRTAINHARIMLQNQKDSAGS